MMYFDDVSRCTVSWQPSGESNGISTSKQREIQKRAAQDKVEALNRMLGAYNAETSVDLTPDEVKDEMYSWATRNGLIEVDFEKEVYTSILGMTICQAKTIPGIIAGFWQAVIDVVAIENICETESIDWKGNESKPSIYMIVLPNCSALYTYKTMNKVFSAIEYCEDMCTNLGKKFKVIHFHPTFKNAPKMLHPKKTSPFPCLGLQFESCEDEQLEKTLNEADQNSFNMEFVDEQRSVLESLYQGASASKTKDVSVSVGIYSKQEMIERTLEWVMQYKYSNKSEYGHHIKGLELSDFIDEWQVIEGDSTEEAYSRFWQAVIELITTREKNPPFLQTKSNQNIITLSTMIIFKQFQLYNFYRFKRFAITVNASLKQLIPEDVTIEVFHPEYFGQSENYNELRRSPYPSILISLRDRA